MILPLKRQNRCKTNSIYILQEVVFYDEVLLLMDTEPAGAAVGDDCCRNSANIGFDSMTSLRTCDMNHSIVSPTQLQLINCLKFASIY